MYTDEGVRAMFPLKSYPLTRDQTWTLKALRRVALATQAIIDDATRADVSTLNGSVDGVAHASPAHIMRAVAVYIGAQADPRGTAIAIAARMWMQSSLAPVSLVSTPSLMSFISQRVVDEVLWTHCPECLLPPSSLAKYDVNLDSEAPAVVVTGYADSV